MKTIIQWAVGILLLGLGVLSSQAAFNSLYVFGDGLSATADPNAPGDQYYYGQRWSNGRVWVEVLAQRQGLAFDNAQNDSYWDHNSVKTLTDVENFVAPPDVANDLFVVWVCNADTFDAATAATPLSFAQWQATNALSQANHLQIITTLYAKGVRTLVMPNAVDLSEIPAFNAGSLVPMLHAGCVDYNEQFSNTIAQARALCPGLTIYTPDFFSLLNNALTNAASYGLTNALSSRGYSIDAYSDPNIADLTLDGQGTNYIFWDPQDPTAMFHAVMADVVQQIISPVQISRIVALEGSNRLDIANAPLGLNGYVEGSTNIMAKTWSNVTGVTCTNTTLSVYVPTPPPLGSTNTISPALDGVGLPPGGTPIVTALEFYRLHFPYAWSWP